MHIMARLTSTSFWRHPLFRPCVAFWLLGLINNVLYVIILSAALDLVGADIPKGLVLLADVAPSFAIKLVAPYFIHRIPYNLRTWSFVLLSFASMLIIALSPESRDPSTIAVKMFAVGLASLSSGAGEMSFLGYTHYYGQMSLAAWSSGTGFAGIAGAGAYFLTTNIFRLSTRQSTFLFSVLPFVMLISYFAILPPPPPVVPAGIYQTLPRDSSEESSEQTERLLADNHPVPVAADDRQPDDLKSPSFQTNLRRVKALLIPFMLPLFLIYMAEYIINQGVVPTLLFPLNTTPFTKFRDFYPTYAMIYQVGVFLSRSSTPFFRVHHLYAPALLQWANLGLLILQALFTVLPNVWLVFLVVFWEGLLGGLIYVNAFAEVTDRVPLEDREFSLGATSVSDSAGVFLAALLSMPVEKGLCRYQVRHGRDWCRRAETL